MDKNDRRLDLILKYLFPALAALSFFIISYLKIDSLNSWQYTSDLFLYDQFMKEMVFSNNLAEFTYGNILGDHVYLYLFLLYPVKLLLQSRMIYFFVLINPFLFFLSALAIQKVLIIWTNKRTALLLGITYLGGFGFLYSGLLEGVYAYHPDTGLGFIFIGLVCCFLLQENNKQQSSVLQTLIIMISILIPATKEEFAIMGVIFFGILFVATKRKSFLFLGLLSLFFIIGDIFLLEYFQTPFNRTNSTLFMNLINGLKSDIIGTLFYSRRWGQLSVITYWSFVFGSTGLFHLLWIKKKTVDPYLAATFYTGMAKIGASLLLLDFKINSWHNLPGVMMVLFVLIILISKIEINNKYKYLTVPILLAILSWGLFFTIEFPTIARRQMDNMRRKTEVESYERQIADLLPYIQPDKIIAVPMFSGTEFVDRRFIFYPRGIEMNPIGIADYIVLPIDISHIYTGNFDTLYPIENHSDQFELIGTTKNFNLYQRTGLKANEKEEREIFFNTFNLEFLIPLP